MAARGRLANMERFGVDLNKETNAASAGHDNSSLSYPLLIMAEIKETNEQREKEVQESMNGLYQ